MNTNTLKLAVLSLGVLLAASSCDKQGIRESVGEGTLNLSVGLPDQTKVLSGNDLLETAVVNIYKDNFGGLIRTGRFADTKGSLCLPAASYRVDVLAGNLSKDNPSRVSWDEPAYKGSREFTIEAGKTVSVLVECGIISIMSEIEFDPSINESLYPDYSFTIGLENDKAVYTSANSGSRAYFLSDIAEPTLYWEFKGTRKINGDIVTKSGIIADACEGTVYRIRPRFVYKDGLLDMDLDVETDTEIIRDIIIFDPASTGLSASSKYEIWAGHATVWADVDENTYSDRELIKFEYSSDGEDWHSADAVWVEPRRFQGVLRGLTPETTYTYRLNIGGEIVGDTMQFTTESTQQPQNPSFEIYSNAESKKYYSFYDPSHELWNSKYWETGNQGSTSVGNPVSMPDTEDKVDGEASACLKSQYVVIKFAAASVSTGEFAGLDGMNGKVNFGRPFTARPTALRFWMKYKGGPINRVGGSQSLAERGDPDVASMMVALGYWSHNDYGGSPDCPVQVNTGKKETLVSYPDLPETIAYGIYDLPYDKASGEWEEITLPLEYYDTKKYPTHIIINAAASKYGDYFTGCDSSVMWLDKLELLYE